MATNPNDKGGHLLTNPGDHKTICGLTASTTSVAWRAWARVHKYMPARCLPCHIKAGLVAEISQPNGSKKIVWNPIQSWEKGFDED